MRQNFEDLKISFDKTGRLPKQTIADILDELKDLRSIQEDARKLLECNFQITLPMSGHGSKAFSIFRDLRTNINKYWNNRQSR